MSFQITSEVEELGQQLAAAIECTVDPNVSPDVRLQAYELIQKVQGDRQQSVICGFLLSSKDRKPQLRHFGLQLLEEIVKYRWNEFSQEQKVYIKERSMELLSTGTESILTEHLYIKDKVSRIIVEMIKREWPQQWPELLEELHAVAKKGTTQTELVLFIFLRLSEDIATLQTLESISRRKDIQQGLVDHMTLIYAFFLTVLEDSYMSYKQQPSDSHLSAQYRRIVQVLLMVLTSYAEWIPLLHVFSGEKKLLTSLFYLLSEAELQSEAVECLLQIISRKDRNPVREGLLELFSDDYLRPISDVAKRASQDTTEKSYRFLKVLTQVVTGLGLQLCSQLDRESSVKVPVNFPGYLKVLLNFTNHPSLAVYAYTINVWGFMFKHQVLSRHPALKDALPEWAQVVFKKVVKHGLPSIGDSTTRAYTSIEMYSDEEYISFFFKVRSETLINIRQATTICPLLLYTCSKDWLSRLLNQMDDDNGSSVSDALSPKYLEWEALSLVMDAVMISLCRKKEFDIPMHEVKGMLISCLQLETKDPLVSSSNLSIISALCQALHLMPEVAENVLDKLFSVASFSFLGDSVDLRDKAVRNLRKHSLALFIRLTLSHPVVLFPAFDDICSAANRFVSSSKKIYQMDKAELYEGLVQLSNYMNDYEKQKAFLDTVFSQLQEAWVNVSKSCQSLQEFMSYVGLDQPPQEDGSHDTCATNRMNISFCVTLLLAVVRRCSYPTDLAVAQRGGYVQRTHTDGTVIYRTAAAPCVLRFLPGIFSLMRALNGLWCPEAVSNLSNEFCEVHLIPEDEKGAMLGLPSVGVHNPYTGYRRSRTPLEKMQFFLGTVRDQLCHLLGVAGGSLGREIYQLPHLADYVVHSLLYNIPFFPSHRLRQPLKTCRLLIHHCSEEDYEVFALPILSHLCPIMAKGLAEKWRSISEDSEGTAKDERENEKKEILEDIVLRVTTREYLVLLRTVLMKSSKSRLPVCEDDANVYSNMDCDNVEIEEDNAKEPSSTTNTSLDLGTLGVLVMRCDSICQSIMTVLIKSLTWNDSASVCKAAPLISAVLQWLTTEGRQHLNEEAVQQVMMAILESLFIHGQHDTNLALLLNLGVLAYELFSPLFSGVKEVFLLVPGVRPQDVIVFEGRLTSLNIPTNKSNKTDRMKRDCFRKLVNCVIGKSVGESFKIDKHLQDLPPIFKAPRPKQPRLDELPDMDLCALFGPSFVVG